MSDILTHTWTCCECGDTKGTPKVVSHTFIHSYGPEIERTWYFCKECYEAIEEGNPIIGKEG